MLCVFNFAHHFLFRFFLLKNLVRQRKLFEGSKKKEKKLGGRTQMSLHKNVSRMSLASSCTIVARRHLFYCFVSRTRE